jgi:hypothetical protein
VKINQVEFNNRRKDFVVTVGARTLHFPYSKVAPHPGARNTVIRAYVDPELGSEAFTYVLADQGEGTVHVDHVLEYNEDPEFMWELFIHKLTAEVKKRLKESDVPKREIVRRLRTSPSQLYRLLDEERASKSLHQIFAILHTLDCDIDLVIKKGRKREVIEWAAEQPVGAGRV